MRLGIRFLKKGFTLIELLIAIAIIAILAAVAVPSYLSHLKAAEFSPTVTAANKLKPYVAACFTKTKSFKSCSQGNHSIPQAVTAKAGMPGATVTNGVIMTTAPPDAEYGVAHATYILSPTYTIGSSIKWSATGTACVNNYADC